MPKLNVKHSATLSDNLQLVKLERSEQTTVNCPCECHLNITWYYWRFIYHCWI